ncbi:hypothetical protein VTK73DRAFT_2043 [Phialemonium thermophilum]|uniref:P-loop containing nucleoside triphosphate hydrolase protein n=1 Tax=Phialemonium thermophilum TaxID=223376 RepID=A0ABR3VSN7_9PEZI
MAPPIFVATHPRACSTAFERVFMTRRDVLNCVHEPFGDAFYYGPERLSSRFANDPAAREASGCSQTTYADIVNRIDELAKQDKRVFIKDMAYYLSPEGGAPAARAPSLLNKGVKGSAQPGTHQPNGDRGSVQTNGTGGHGDEGAGNDDDDHDDDEAGNPTVLPTERLRKYHFAFLIRHPRRAIPSYFRCTVPPLDEVTKFHNFMPSEAGYAELRRLFDYLQDRGIVGPDRVAGPGSLGGPGEGGANGTDRSEGGGVPILVIDADDLLDKPAAVIETFCRSVGIAYTPDMLRWEDEENQQYAARVFEKWNGFHDDVLGSTYLKPRGHAAKEVTVAEENEEWKRKFGEEAQKIIRKCVDDNTPDYEYLKSFAIKV